jgi:hypothetical protein
MVNGIAPATPDTDNFYFQKTVAKITVSNAHESLTFLQVTSGRGSRAASPSLLHVKTSLTAAVSSKM